MSILNNFGFEYTVARKSRMEENERFFHAVLNFSSLSVLLSKFHHADILNQAGDFFITLDWKNRRYRKRQML